MGAPLTGGLALLVALAAGLLGITLERGDQVTHFGLFLLESPLGWLLAGTSAATFVAALVASRGRSWTTLLVVTAVTSVVVALLVRASLHSDADAINSSANGAFDVANAFTKTFTPPIQHVDAGTTSALLLISAALSLLSAAFGAAGLQRSHGHAAHRSP